MKVIIVALFILFLIGCASTHPVSREGYEIAQSKRDSMPCVDRYENYKYNGYDYYVSTNRIRVIKVYRYYR